MTGASQARYRARFAGSGADLAAAQRLRHLAFVEAAGRTPRPDRRDADAHDAACRHVLVEPRAGGAPVACFRLLPLADGRGIGASYAARFYGLDGLAAWRRPMAEIGRFCTRPGLRDPDVLRVAWAALAGFVERSGTAFLFGCASFRGIETAAHADAFALLSARHLAPVPWRPREAAPDIVRFADCAARAAPDPRRGLRQMPPLLRGYLALGAQVSDHAVIDRDLGTLHVFAGLDLARIPKARARTLRRAAA